MLTKTTMLSWGEGPRERARQDSSALFWAVVGYLAAGTAVWFVAPPEWTLSFPQTLAASVDSQTYGHPIEHYAESLLVVMLIACVLGAALLIAIATFGRRLVRADWLGQS
jgi:hypothetical protein